MKIIIGSRGSDLALWQANHVKDSLEREGHEVSINIIVTKGDRIQDLSFDKIEGKGFFTKEIEEALLNKEVDLAVHSHKDLETTMPNGLIIGAVSNRENPTDALLIRRESADESQVLSLKENAVVGTSSARRQSQLRRKRSDFQIEELRGNVPTRIQKLRDGKYDAIVLASAGINRLELDLSDLLVLELNTDDFVPAPAQGVLGLQIREEDTELKSALSNFNQNEVADSIGIERDILRLLEGGCQLPLGAHTVRENDSWKVAVSYAPSKNDVAQVFHYEGKEREGLAERIVAELKGVNA